ncbi:F0F1 ATP synthase subunit A [Candidatus Daviesbacteria bacterium]|nr:F0F1 ATP synthase subunit A [Candidatus Daviesbacteria bacterium]
MENFTYLAKTPISDTVAETNVPAEGETGGEHEIILAPEVLGNLGPLPVTNTLLVSWAVVGLLVVLAIAIRLSLSKKPRGFQNFIELIIEGGFNTVSDLAHSKAKTFFPWVMTFFLFILTANLLGLFPGFTTVTYKEMPLLRSINSDLNMTLSLALLSVFITHFFAIRFLGIKDYIKKWFSLEMFGVFLFVGLLELVGEFTKIVSLSFRLFGNIFAGEVVLGTVSSIFAFIVPLPFYFLELIVAFVQAAVFMMLTLVFMVLLTEKHEAH